MSLQFFLRSLTRLPCWSQASWKSCTKRTPRSTSRRASRQLLANDGLPGSAPYISSMCFGSLRDVHQLRRAGLHAVGHLERVDARGDLGIADVVQAHLVQLR